MSSPKDLQQQLASRELFRLLLSADLKSAVPDGFHFVDDDDLLDRWSAGELSDSERNQIICHLSECLECSDVLREMVHSESFDLPELPSEIRPHPTVVAPMSAGSVRANSWLLPASILAVACSLIALIGYFSYRGRGNDQNVMLAQADYAQLTSYLTAREFSNLSVGLAGKGKGSGLIGSTEADRIQVTQLAERVRTEPQNVPLRLNYARILFKVGKISGEGPATAEAQFQAALALDGDNPYARLGQGMVLFRQGQPEASLAVFQELGDHPGLSTDLAVNQVVCLLALGRKAEALTLWETVPEELRNLTLDGILNADALGSDER